MVHTPKPKLSLHLLDGHTPTYWLVQQLYSALFVCQMGEPTYLGLAQGRSICLSQQELADSCTKLAAKHQCMQLQGDRLRSPDDVPSLRAYIL